jgi:hypothetical protein
MGGCGELKEKTLVQRAPLVKTVSHDARISPRVEAQLTTCAHKARAILIKEIVPCSAGKLFERASAILCTVH